RPPPGGSRAARRGDRGGGRSPRLPVREGLRLLVDLLVLVRGLSGDGHEHAAAAGHAGDELHRDRDQHDEGRRQDGDQDVHAVLEPLGEPAGMQRPLTRPEREVLVEGERVDDRLPHPHQGAAPWRRPKLDDLEPSVRAAPRLGEQLVRGVVRGQARGEAEAAVLATLEQCRPGRRLQREPAVERLSAGWAIPGAVGRSHYREPEGTSYSTPADRSESRKSAGSNACDGASAPRRSYPPAAQRSAPSTVVRAVRPYRSEPLTVPRLRSSPRRASQAITNLLLRRLSTPGPSGRRGISASNARRTGVRSASWNGTMTRVAAGPGTGTVVTALSLVVTLGVSTCFGTVMCSPAG